MHLPPAVSYKVVRSRWHFYGLCLLWGSAALCAFGFSRAQSHSPLSSSAWLALLVCAPASFVAWWRTANGLLQWDGARWFWADWGDTPVRALRVSLDLQYCMLLQLHAINGKSAWLFLERDNNPARWLALRRALFVHHAVHGTAARPHGDGVSP